MAGDNDDGDRSLLNRLNALRPSNVDLDRTQPSPSTPPSSSEDGGDDLARRFLGLRGTPAADDVKSPSLQPSGNKGYGAGGGDPEEVESIEDMLKELRATQRKALAPGDEKRAEILLKQANEALSEEDGHAVDTGLTKSNGEAKEDLADPINVSSSAAKTEELEDNSSTDEDAEADELLAQILDEVRLRGTLENEDESQEQEREQESETAKSASDSVEKERSKKAPLSFDEHAFPTTPSKEPEPASVPGSDELTLPSAPTSIPVKPKPKSNLRKYTDAEIETWCEICQANAEVRCLGCDGELYCFRCWDEGHTGPDVGYEERQHRCVQYSRPGKPKAAAA